MQACYWCDDTDLFIGIVDFNEEGKLVKKMACRRHIRKVKDILNAHKKG